MEKFRSISRAKLTGKKAKFCGLTCKNAATNVKNQNYVSQQERGRQRRRRLIEIKGGSCKVCGYGKNQAALAFHHLDASAKSFQIDLRKCSNSSWQKLLIEAAKCQLLCHNCHAEIHNPDFST